MAREREVGTLWVGGALSWLEQLCLKSFVDQGQKVTLFSYEEIPNVPRGVVRRDGREIIDTDDFIRYEKKNSFALFADWFRLHMIQQCPGMIWVDTDVYCHRPMDYDSDYVMGFELPGESRVNNAVLGLPADSAILDEMIAFTEDRYSVAPFLPQKTQRQLQAAAQAGAPVHVSGQPWGVWGPMMLSHYVHKHGLQEQVLPVSAFYPVTFRDRRLYMRRSKLVDDALTDETTALHLWASNKRQLGNNHDGLPPEGSFLDKLVQAHRINPYLAPIKGRGYTVFDGALIDQLDLDSVESVADLTGNARSFVLALHHKFDCDIKLINTNRRGKLFADETQPWIEDYVAFLKQNDVAEDRITVVRSDKDLRPVDVLCNLHGFGDGFKVNWLEKFMKRCLHSDTRLFTDVGRGSGGFPFLKRFGANHQIATLDIDGREVHRVRFHPKPFEQEEDESWDETARSLAGTDGWYRPGTNGHSFLFVRRSLDTLVVTFDNLDIAMNKREDRRPWGYSFIEDQGWSMLGVLAGGWTWYREPWVSDQFDDLRDSGFFKQFKRVVFYGASMGGYAACAFSPAAPGCNVVVMSPQSTVDKSVVPWETRYRVVWDRDFTGPYGDAAQVSAAAGKVTLLYDPYEPLDAQHADRFTGVNVQKLRTPLLGHRLGSSLSQMGILHPIILGALNGTLTEHEFYQILRARKGSPRYQRELFKKTISKGHPELAKRLGKHIMKLNPGNRAVRLGLKELV